MIRRADRKDLDGVVQGYEELLAYEQLHGTTCNWQPGVYPVRDTAASALAAGTLYVMDLPGGVRASMILNQVQPEVYGHIRWSYPAQPEEVLVVHTLCVPPSCAGRGMGKEMVKQALQEAQRQERRTVRLDTWHENHRAAALYRGLGFHFAGEAETLFIENLRETLLFFEHPIK